MDELADKLRADRVLGVCVEEAKDIYAEAAGQAFRSKRDPRTHRPWQRRKRTRGVTWPLLDRTGAPRGSIFTKHSTRGNKAWVYQTARSRLPFIHANARRMPKRNVFGFRRGVGHSRISNAASVYIRRAAA